MLEQYVSRVGNYSAKIVQYGQFCNLIVRIMQSQNLPGSLTAFEHILKSVKWSKMGLWSKINAFLRHGEWMDNKSK